MQKIGPSLGSFAKCLANAPFHQQFRRLQGLSLQHAAFKPRVLTTSAIRFR